MLRDAWTLAIETLSWIELKRYGERLALTNATKQLRIKDYRAVGLAHRLVTETLRRKNFVDFLLNKTLQPKTVNDYKLGQRAFLRLYTYETKVRKVSLEKASRIANMGRNILGWHELKDVEEFLGAILSINPKQAMQGLEETEKVGLETYNPTWFVKYCYKLLGRDQALKFLEKSAEITPTYVRINTLKGAEDVLLQKTEQEQVELQKVPQLKYTYKLLHTKKPLPRTQSFRGGLFYIQDKASCLAAEIADPKPSDTVFDVCAAPGSKTTFLAQLMGNRGEIVSFDYSTRRIQVWKKETKHMGVTNAQALVTDTRNGLPVNTKADLVILDPPCTSTGTFGKTPDAKWRLTKRSVLGMAKIQSEMIEQCAPYVKDGGFLVYSTCSITVEENENVIGEFLKLNPEFKLVDAKPKVGLPGLKGLTKCQRLYPNIHECNGFFVAKLRKEV